MSEMNPMKNNVKNLCEDLGQLVHLVPDLVDCRVA